MMRIKHLKFEVLRAVHIKIRSSWMWRLIRSLENEYSLKTVCSLRSQKPVIFRNL